MSSNDANITPLLMPSLGLSIWRAGQLRKYYQMKGEESDMEDPLIGGPIKDNEIVVDIVPYASLDMQEKIYKKLCEWGYIHRPYSQAAKDESFSYAMQMASQIRGGISNYFAKIITPQPYIVVHTKDGTTLKQVTLDRYTFRKSPPVLGTIRISLLQAEEAIKVKIRNDLKDQGIGMYEQAVHARIRHLQATILLRHGDNPMFLMAARHMNINSFDKYDVAPVQLDLCPPD